MMKKFLLVFFVVIHPLWLFSQAPDDSLAQVLVKRHILINAAKMTMSGYRVQIYYGSQRARAMEIRSEVLKDLPGIPAYLIYQQPNFKVRLGDFKTRFEAQKLLEEVTSDFPAAFVVKDEVKLPDIK